MKCVMQACGGRRVCGIHTVHAVRKYIQGFGITPLSLPSVPSLYLGGTKHLQISGPIPPLSFLNPSICPVPIPAPMVLTLPKK